MKPFFILLETNHNIDKMSSTLTEETGVLQRLIDAHNIPEYDKKRREFEEQGSEFRVTQSVIYQTSYEGEKIDVKVALQIKGSSITWYFWVIDNEGRYGMDQYPQTFRDLLYNAAAKCHEGVTNGCGLYYRGSNAIHVKTMHHVEDEANHNHNHYRVKDNKLVQPIDLEQHLTAFKEHEVYSTFFTPGEADRIIEKFNLFHAGWTAKKEDGRSEEETYYSNQSQQLNRADLLELKLFGAQQEPCRIDVTELRVDYDKAREAITRSLISAEESDHIRVMEELAKVKEQYDAILKYRERAGSRGLMAELAMTRQIEESTKPTILTVVKKDDSLGEAAVIPDWATSILQQRGESIEKSYEEALERSKPADRCIALNTKDVLQQLKTVLTQRENRDAGAAPTDAVVVAEQTVAAQTLYPSVTLKEKVQTVLDDSEKENTPDYKKPN